MGMNRDMTPTSIIQPAPDRAAATQLKPGSKRATGGGEDIASASAAAGEPLFQIVTRQDFSAATYLLEVRHPLLPLATGTVAASAPAIGFTPSATTLT